MPRRLVIAGLLAASVGGCADLRDQLDQLDAQLQSYLLPEPAPQAAKPAKRAKSARAAKAGGTVPVPRPKPAPDAADVASAPYDSVDAEIAAQGDPAQPDAPPPPEVPGPAAVDSAVSAEPDIDPQSLIGAGEGELVARLGEPAARRSEGAAQVWAYGEGECRLEVYLYADVVDGGLQVLAWHRPGRDDGACAGQTAAP